MITSPVTPEIQFTTKIDPQSNAVYIQLSNDQIATTIPINVAGVFIGIDLSKSSKVIGIEIIGLKLESFQDKSYKEQIYTVLNEQQKPLTKTKLLSKLNNYGSNISNQTLMSYLSRHKNIFCRVKPNLWTLVSK